jgi:hypothetical protein
MKILSIDVGIKNLAYCLFDSLQMNEHFKITKWDIVDLSEKECLQKCAFIENNKPCSNLAKFTKNEKCFCLKHSKKQKFQIPTSEQKLAFIKKQKIEKLFEIANCHNIKHEFKIKKADLINLINNYFFENYCQPIEHKKANEVNLFNIGLNIKTKFNNLFENEREIDFVIIENQISPIATRMKTIQGMIVQYFIMSNINVQNIEFISASNKLKDCNNTNEKKIKTTYSERKKMGITKCLELISTNILFTDQVEYFNQHKKKDDLSDSFLQGIWFINKNQLNNK